jgi:hypothetical protein
LLKECRSTGDFDGRREFEESIEAGIVTDHVETAGLEYQGYMDVPLAPAAARDAKVRGRESVVARIAFAG